MNIAEGAGEYAVDEKARFYRMAKRSATECAGVLDVCQRLRLIEESRYILLPLQKCDFELRESSRG